MIDTWTRSIFPDIESFQRNSSLQRGSIGKVQHRVLVQENANHSHILGIGHTIHLEKVLAFGANLNIIFYLVNPLPSVLDFLQSDITSLGTRNGHFNKYSTGEDGCRAMKYLSAYRFYTISFNKPLGSFDSGLELPLVPIEK